MSQSDAEEMFPPRKGGMVESVRAQSASDESTDPGDEVTPVGGYPSVRVRTEPADSGTARTVLLSSVQPYTRLLGQDSGRRSAIVLAVDSDVYLTTDSGVASTVAGSTNSTGAFYLPAGIAIPVDNAGQYWVAATTTATSSRVSVLISRDSTP